MIPPKCKLCGETHWGLCPRARQRVVKAKVAEIAARPVKLGSKGRAKKAAKRAKSSSKKAAVAKAAAIKGKSGVVVMDESVMILHPEPKK